MLPIIKNLTINICGPNSLSHLGTCFQYTKNGKMKNSFLIYNQKFHVWLVIKFSWIMAVIKHFYKAKEASNTLFLFDTKGKAK